MLDIIGIKDIVEIFEEKLSWIAKDEELRSILARDLISRIGLDNIEFEMQFSSVSIDEITTHLGELYVDDDKLSLFPYNVEDGSIPLLESNASPLAEEGIVKNGSIILFTRFENTYFIYSNEVLLECNPTLQKMYLHKIEDIVQEYDQAHKELGDFVNNLEPVQKLYIDVMCLWPYYKTKKDLSYLEYLTELSSTEVLDIFPPSTLSKRYYMLWEIFACNSGIRKALRSKDNRMII